MDPKHVMNLPAVTSMSISCRWKKQASCFITSEPYDKNLMILIPKPLTVEKYSIPGYGSGMIPMLRSTNVARRYENWQIGRKVPQSSIQKRVVTWYSADFRCFHRSYLSVMRCRRAVQESCLSNFPLFWKKKEAPVTSRKVLLYRLGSRLACLTFLV